MGMLAGIRVVKAFVQEDREIRRFADSSRRLRDSRLTVDNAAVTFTAAMGLLFALGGLVVWYIGGRDVLFGSMTLGSLMAFLAFLAMFYAPLTTIAESTTWFASFFSTSRRICALLDVPSESEQPQPAAPLGPVPGRRRVPTRVVRLRSQPAGAGRHQLCDRAGRDGGRGGPQRLGQVDAGEPHRPAVRVRLPGRSASTASTCGRRIPGSSAGKSAWFPRNRFCSAARWPRTSPTAMDKPRRNKSSWPPGMPIPTNSSCGCPSPTKRNWAKGAPGCPAENGSGSRSPGPCCSIRRS